MPSRVQLRRAALHGLELGPRLPRVTAPTLWVALFRSRLLRSRRRELLSKTIAAAPDFSRKS